MMRDQAAALRKLIEQKARGINLEFHNNLTSLFPENLPVAVFSGSEEETVALATLTANCALSLGLQGRKVSLLEAHSHDVSASLILGLSLPLPLHALASGDHDFQDALGACRKGVRLIRSLEAIETIDQWLPEKRRAFYKDMYSFLDNHSDYVFINEVSLKFSLSKEKIILVFSTTHDSVINAYARLKKIAEVNPRAEIGFIVCTTTAQEETSRVADKFRSVAENFLKKTVFFLGAFPVTGEVIKSVKTQKPFIEFCPFSQETRAIKKIAKSIIAFITVPSAGKRGVCA